MVDTATAASAPGPDEPTIFQLVGLFEFVFATGWNGGVAGPAGNPALPPGAEIRVPTDVVPPSPPYGEIAVPPTPPLPIVTVADDNADTS